MQFSIRDSYCLGFRLQFTKASWQSAPAGFFVPVYPRY
jgi:hypothetical protein